MLSQKTDGAAEMGSVCFHFADFFCQNLDFCVCELHSAESDAVAGQMMLVYKVIIFIQFFIRYPFIFVNIGFGAAGLGAVGTVLGAVAAAGICENVNAHMISFVFSPECLSKGNKLL